MTDIHGRPSFGPPSRRVSVAPESMTSAGAVSGSAAGGTSRMSVAGRVSMGGPRRHTKSIGGGNGGLQQQAAVVKENPPLNSAGDASQRLSEGKRMSLYAGGQKSLGGSIANGGGSRSDPRPLSDKAFMAESIRRVVSYLVSHGYSEPLNAKSLVLPTTKEFLSVLQFLGARALPEFKVGARPEQTVPALFKTLRYPYVINKSAVQSVSAPHTWSSLLGALVWLVELLQYSEMVDEKEYGVGDELAEDNSEEKVFFRYLARAYESFMSGQDDYQDLEDDVQQSFIEKADQLRTDIVALEQHTQTARARIEEMDATARPLEIAQQKREDLLNELGKFEAYVAKLEEVHEGLQTKLQQEQEETAALASELRTLQTERESLAEQIEAQPISPADVEKMNRTQEALKATMKSLVTQKEALEMDKFEIETRASKLLDEVEHVVLQYNKLGTETRLIPSTAKYSNGVDFELAFNMHSATIQDILSKDVRRELKPAFQKIEQMMEEKRAARHENMLRARGKLSQVEEQIADSIEDIERNSSTLSRLGESLDADRLAIAELAKSQMLEVESLLTTARKLKADALANLASSQKGLDLLQKEVTDLATVLDNDREAFHSIVVEVLASLMDHKQYISQELASLESSIRE